MKDIFGRELRVGTFVMFQRHSFIIGKIINAQEDLEYPGRSTYQIATEHNKWDYETWNASLLINIDESITLIEDFSKKIDNINANENSIITRLAKKEQEKKEKNENKRKLRDEIKPGDCFTGGNYNNHFMYLGRDEDKMHMYLKMSRAYRYNRAPSDANYTLYSSKGSFIQKLKSKKLPTSRINAEEVDHDAMFDELARTVRDAQTGRHFDPERYISLQDIEYTRNLVTSLRG